MKWWRATAAAAAIAMVSGAAVAQEKELVFGLQCDRTGATQTVGVFLCPGYHDYIALVNSKGGIDGFKIRVIEIDHEYKVPPAMEAHERFKKEGAVLESLYGTPQTAALTKKLEEDKILGTSPGFGTDARSTCLQNRTSLFGIVSGWSLPSRRTRSDGILRLISTV